MSLAGAKITLPYSKTQPIMDDTSSARERNNDKILELRAGTFGAIS